MPTGYTYRIEKDISFEEFVWDCARAFGALLHMRDERCDAKVKLREPGVYEREQLERAQEELADFLKKTSPEIDEMLEKEYQEELEYYEKRIAKSQETKKKYEKMLKQVEGWIPPTSEHEGLKQFMIDQIVDSMDFDCCFDYYGRRPERAPFVMWYKKKKDQLEKDVEFYREQYKKEMQRCNEHNAWIKQLDESVPCPKRGW